MSRYVSRGLALVLFTGGLTLLGAGIANAADTTGDDGLLSGTQIVAPVTAPIDVTGNAVSVLGDSLAGGAVAPSPTAIPAAPAPAPAPATTSGTDSALGGTQAVVEAAAPIAVQGNAISVVGDSSATPAPVAAAPVAAAPVAEPAAPASAPATSAQTMSAPTTSGSDSVAGCTQVLPDIAVPVTVGGNAVSVLGDSSSEGASAPTAAAAPVETTDGASTSGNDSIAGGTQVAPVVELPVFVGGNAISILGDAASTGSSTSIQQEGTRDDVTTTGNDGVLGGTQILPSISLPITVGDNAISVLGDTETGAGSTTGVGTPVVPTVPAGPTTPSAPVTSPLTTDAGTSNGVNGAATTGVTPTTGLGTGTGLGFTLGSTGAFGSAGTATAALSTVALASTGVEIAPLLGAIGFLLIIGFGLLLTSRRRA
ncbi:chaplin family protein [Conyzicola sp.]|uniref:chaplin family protein n=1 Tax=Conyzicola sp. TaxID=1969404 RepID=UPI003989D5F1